MKWIFMLLVAAATGNATTITFDTVTPDQFAFSLRWGSVLEYGYTSVITPGPRVAVEVGKDDQFGQFLDKIRITCSTGFSGLGAIVFLFPLAPNSVAFADAIYRVDTQVASIPTSITATPDGFGAHIVFDRLQSPGLPSVPDGGSSAALLGFGLVASLGIRRLVPAC